MKVLEPGKRPKWSIERKCSECGAKLLVDFDDLSKTFRPTREEEEVYVGFDCGHCDVRNDLPKGKWPKNDDDIPSKSDWDKAQKATEPCPGLLGKRECGGTKPVKSPRLCDGCQKDYKEDPDGYN